MYSKDTAILQKGLFTLYISIYLKRFEDFQPLRQFLNYNLEYVVASINPVEQALYKESHFPGI